MTFEEWWMSREAEIAAEQSLQGYRTRLSIIASAAWNAALDAGVEAQLKPGPETFRERWDSLKVRR
jgi:hypothetical protein